jgi:molybdopterin-guanine dinucleotide biosynthesis protein B
MRYHAIAFTGPSNSGKTTLIEKIALKLAKERSVAIIKHDPSDKARFDREGKDSDRFFKTGAEVAVLSPERTTLLSHRPRSVEAIAGLFGEFDLLMVEGLKHLPLPRIGIFRGKIDTDYLPVVQALAIDKSIDLSETNLPSNIEIMDLDDIDTIIGWIDKNAIRIKGS